jgi:hypothetical protein
MLLSSKFNIIQFFNSNFFDIISAHSDQIQLPRKIKLFHSLNSMFSHMYLIHLSHILQPDRFRDILSFNLIFSEIIFAHSAQIFLLLLKFKLTHSLKSIEAIALAHSTQILFHDNSNLFLSFNLILSAISIALSSSIFDDLKLNIVPSS